MKKNKYQISILLLFLTPFLVLSMCVDFARLNGKNEANCSGINSLTVIYYKAFEYQGYDGRQNVFVWQSCDNISRQLTNNTNKVRTYIAKWSVDSKNVIVDTMEYTKHPRYGSPPVVPFETIPLSVLGLRKLNSEIKLEDFSFLRELNNHCSSTYFDENNKPVLYAEGVEHKSFTLIMRDPISDKEEVVFRSANVFNNQPLAWYSCDTGLSIKLNKEKAIKYLILNNQFLVDTQKNEYVEIPSNVDYDFITRE